MVVIPLRCVCLAGVLFCVYWLILSRLSSNVQRWVGSNVSVSDVISIFMIYCSIGLLEQSVAGGWVEEFLTVAV